MSRRSRTMLGAVCGCALAAMLPATAVAPALASAPRLVRIGSTPAVPAGARELGAVASGTDLHLAVALMPRDPAALQRYASAVATPGSSSFRHYLTPSAFTRRFGATGASIEAVTAALRARGLAPGHVTANGLSIPVTASAGSVEQALSVKLERLALPGSTRAIVNDAAPSLAGDIAPLVQAIVGLDTVATPTPLFVKPDLAAHAVAHATPHVATGGPQPCEAAAAAAPANDAYTADQIASAYGFSGLYRAGDEGQGQTIALYELEPDDPADIAAYQQCYGTHASVSYVEVDGGAGTGAGSGEAALDIEDAIGLAPKANILVYQAPNSNSNGPGAGPYDNFSAIISQDRAQIVSASWGQCESMEGSADAHAEETLFEEAAAQGQTVISAAGDDGSEDCYTGDLLSGTELAVDDPSSQQFVTGVGGTTLSALGPRPTESVWNNGGNLGIVTSPLGIGPGASGGGLSSLWSMPSYQSSASASLNVVGSSSGGDCGASRCREVPDVSADADPSTGYLIYYNGSGTESGATGWQGIGGTSASAPLWAALVALANASSSCHGANLGFANPGLYEAAASDYGNVFNDIKTGNNDFTGTNGGKYAAGPGYDLASGLGTPNASALAPALCSLTLRIANPGAQSTTVDKSARLQIRALGTDGATPRYSAHGLPTGLKLNPATGLISGKARKVGAYTITVSSTGAYNEVVKSSFAWTVGRPPTLSHVRLSSLGTRRAELRLTVSHGRGAPALRQVTVSLPRSLRLRARTGKITVAGAGGAHIRFTAKVVHGALRLTASSASSILLITVRSPALTVSGSRPSSVTVGATAVDALGNTTVLRARVRVA